MRSSNPDIDETLTEQQREVQQALREMSELKSDAIDAPEAADAKSAASVQDEPLR